MEANRNMAEENPKYYSIQLNNLGGELNYRREN